MTLKPLEARLTALESRQQERILVSWFKGDGETFDECLKRYDIPGDYPRGGLVVLEVVYEPPVAGA